jgi:phosphate-selective porin OprO/OprP
MTFHRWLTTAAVAGLFTVSLSGADSDDIKSLKEQIERLDQKVKILERNRELESEAAEKSKTAPRITAGENGFSLSSADTNFVLKVRGYVQADARFYLDDKLSVNDTFLLRRVRPIFEGTLFENYDYRVMLDFASGTSTTLANNGFVQDAYLNVHYWPEFQIQAGKFKEPVGLERLQSGANLLFVERGFPTQLVPNRDVGVQLQGELFTGALNYAAGVFNGVSDGGSGDFESGDDEKDVAGRIFLQPFKNTEVAPLRQLGFGIAGTYGNQEGELRRFVTPGQQSFFSYRTGSGSTFTNVIADGAHWRAVPQAYWYWGPFGVFGEYVISSQKLRRDAHPTSSSATNQTFGVIHNTAWQVSASYILTGEENSYRGFKPKKPLSFANGGWGAWEIAARIGELDVDDEVFPVFASSTSASKATSWGLGLNWYLNRNVKLNLNFENTDFEVQTIRPFAVTAQDEKVILSRIQVAF